MRRVKALDLGVEGSGVWRGTEIPPLEFRSLDALPDPTGRGLDLSHLGSGARPLASDPPPGDGRRRGGNRGQRGPGASVQDPAGSGVESHRCTRQPAKASGTHLLDDPPSSAAAEPATDCPHVVVRPGRVPLPRPEVPGLGGGGAGTEGGVGRSRYSTDAGPNEVRQVEAGARPDAATVPAAPRSAPGLPSRRRLPSRRAPPRYTPLRLPGSRLDGKPRVADLPPARRPPGARPGPVSTAGTGPEAPGKTVSAHAPVGEPRRRTASPLTPFARAYAERSPCLRRVHSPVLIGRTSPPLSLGS